MEKLKPCLYLALEKLETGQITLQELDYNLPPPEKVYGGMEEYAKRYLNTFRLKEGSMGILLSGTKGSGKTMLARMVLKESELPIIWILSPIKSSLMSYLQTLEQDVVVFIDEFEKIYKTKEMQDEFLPILDNVSFYKRLFVFTSNTADVNEFLLNRPGRIRYHKTFFGLEDDLIEEVVEDLLEVGDKNETIDTVKMLGQISFDSLTAIISEMNMYNQSAKEVLKYLNVSIEYSTYRVILIIKGKRYETSFYGHPVASEEYSINYKEERWYESQFLIKLREYDITFLGGGRVEMTSNIPHSNTHIIFDKYNGNKLRLD